VTSEARVSWLSDFLDNAKLVATAMDDWHGNLNPFDDRFLTGDAPNTAREVEEQLAREQGREVDQDRIDRSSQAGLELIGRAAYETAEEITEEVADKAKAAVTWGPWILGGVLIAGVVVLGIVYLPKPRS
jgi:hypothetical protein